MKPILVSSGEPAGVGPDLCLALANSNFPVVIIGDPSVLKARAKLLNQSISWASYSAKVPFIVRANHLTVLPLTCPEPVIPGELNSSNASYVINILKFAAERCMQNEFSAFVTAPIHKGIINQAGFDFTGHTEFLQEAANSKRVVMMLACDAMKVALATTHLPLKAVSKALSIPHLIDLTECLHTSLRHEFKILKPKIAVAGLNPHAGEGGYLGSEEQEIIIPALRELRNRGIDVDGPYPADTMFTPKYLDKYDVFLTMYHDQGLPVLKYAGFGQAINITLGLPFIRTSVDHGTALDLAGTGLAESGSLLAAVKMAHDLAQLRASSHVMS